MRYAICHRGNYSDYQVGIHRAGCSDIKRREVEKNWANVEIVEADSGEAAAQYVEDNADDDGDGLGPIQTVADCQVYPCCKVV